MSCFVSVIWLTRVRVRISIIQLVAFFVVSARRLPILALLSVCVRLFVDGG